MKEAVRRYTCDQCDGICFEADFLHAPNPFDPEDEVTGCPHCSAVNTLVGACADRDCKKQAGGGYPDAYGFRYLWLCWDHSPNNKNGTAPAVNVKIELPQ